jgi:hypothetical protein
MELLDGKYHCALCGAELGIPPRAKLRVGIKATSGTPTVRRIIYDGAQVHACALAEQPLDYSAPGTASTS